MTVHRVAGVLVHAGVVPGDRDRSQRRAGRWQLTYKAGGWDADAVRVEVGELYLIAVRQPGRAGAGDVARPTVAGAIVPDPDGDHGVARRIRLGAEGQRDVDVLPDPVAVFMRRDRGDRDVVDME